MSGKIYLGSYLEQSKDRHGGSQRSIQLAEAFEALGIASIPVEENKKALFRVFLSSILKYHRLFYLIILLRKKGASIKGCILAMLYAAWLLKLIESQKFTLVYLDIARGREIILANLLSLLDCKYICIPHNIEFLVAGQDNPYFINEGYAFSMEVNSYRGAVANYTISDFDKLILESLGIKNVQFYPFYPSKNKEDFLLNISESRKTSAKSYFLIVGSIGNTPTLNGMMKIISTIRKHNQKDRFILAGFGTERLARDLPSNIELYGSVTDDQLNELMIGCLGMVIAQPQTSGFLTRLVDANIAQIPVFILKGYFQAEGLKKYGIYVINTINEIHVINYEDNKLAFLKPDNNYLLNY